MAKHGLLAVPDINQGQGKVSIGRQEKIFSFTLAGAYKPEGGSPVAGREKHHFPFCFFQKQSLFT